MSSVFLIHVLCAILAGSVFQTAKALSFNRERSFAEYAVASTTSIASFVCLVYMICGGE